MKYFSFNRLWLPLMLVAALSVGICGTASAKSAEQIEIEVDAALKAFESQVAGGKEFLAKARGALVFPKVIKGGIGIGGHYGEGALRVGGKTVDYYSTAAASIGLQLGGQSRTQIVVFMAQDVLGNAASWFHSAMARTEPPGFLNVRQHAGTTWRCELTGAAGPSVSTSHGDTH